MDAYSDREKYEQHVKQELHMIDNDLKDWFLTRRIGIEKAQGMRKQLESLNATGLAMNNADVPPTQMVLWNDIVQGRPDMEDSLSTDAREMKAEKYMKLFKDSTTVQHPCRIPGVAYLRCLHENFKETSQARTKKCMYSFTSFDACRKALLKQQSVAMENAMTRQDLADRRAKAMFERRAVLLDSLSGQPGQ